MHYEIFATVEDFEACNAMPYVRDWFAKLPELVEGGVKVTRMAVAAKPAPKDRAELGGTGQSAL
ncbi:hypothetical protein WBP07_24640 [Novosphingobium sp. BL-8A]|uniref:hypothetical protein n=1 Tax=Novosphingobium sp. BL-8A TaxID=3127639 RepID=UPI00375776E9